MVGKFFTAFQVIVLFGSFSSVILLYILWKKTGDRLAKKTFSFYSVFFIVLFGVMTGNWLLEFLFNAYSIPLSRSFSFSNYPEYFGRIFPVMLILQFFSPAILLHFTVQLLAELFPGTIPEAIKRCATATSIVFVGENVILLGIKLILDYLNISNALPDTIVRIHTIVFVLLIYGGLAAAALYAMVSIHKIKDTIIRSVLKSFLIIVMISLPLIVLEQIFNAFAEKIQLAKKYFEIFPFGIQFHWIMFFGITILCHLKVLKALIHFSPQNDANDILEARLAKFRAEGNLTGRELEIIELTITGISNKEIASKLNISHATVKNHLTNAYRKLGVSSRWELLK